MKSSTYPPTRSELLIGVFLLLVSAALLFFPMSPDHGWGGDFAAYLHQGKALATGTVDRFEILTNYRVENSTTAWIIGPSAYPWGFPAILATVILLFGESIFAMKMLMVGFLLGCQVLTYLLLRGRTSQYAVFAISFVFAINSFVYLFKDNVLSDIPFTFFVLLTLLLSREFLIKKKCPSIANLITLGIVMCAAFSVRANAIALLPTVAFLQVFGQTEFRQGNIIRLFLKGLKGIRLRDLVPYLVFAIGTAIISVNLSEPIQSYANTGHVEIGGFMRLYYTLKTGLIYYAKLPSEFFGVPAVVYVLVVFPVLLIGVIRKGPRNLDLLVFVVFHMAILVLYPGRQGLRFVLPVLPVMLFFLFQGGRQVVDWFGNCRTIKSRSNLVDVVIVVALIVGISGPVTLHALQEKPDPSSVQIASGPYSANSQDVFDYIRETTNVDDTIVFWKPRVLSYLTNRRSAFVVSRDDLIGGGFGYVLVFKAEYSAGDIGSLLVGVTSRNPKYFNAVYSNAEFVLYEILSTD